MSKAVTVGASALLGCILCATPLSLRLLPVQLLRFSSNLTTRSGNAVFAKKVAPPMANFRRLHGLALTNGSRRDLPRKSDIS
jgi:hypothetical protein